MRLFKDYFFQTTDGLRLYAATIRARMLTLRP